MIRINCHRVHSGNPARHKRRVDILQQIDENLERHRGGSNAEMIQRLRVALFGDVDALQKSGTVKLPE